MAETKKVVRTKSSMKYNEKNDTKISFKDWKKDNVERKDYEVIYENIKSHRKELLSDLVEMYNDSSNITYVHIQKFLNANGYSFKGNSFNKFKDLLVSDNKLTPRKRKGT